MLRLTIACLCVVSVLGWPSGAPKDACPTRKPSHGPDSKVGANPGAYSIQAPTTTLTPGQLCKVTIKGGNFKGFMVQGVAAKNAASPPVGSFEGGNTIACNGPADTATHNNPNKVDYTSQTVTYKVPTKPGTYYIRGTIVQDYLNYYPNVYSNKITVA